MASDSSNVTLYQCLPVPRGDWKDPFEVHALRMVLLHNVIIRCYNSQLYHAGQVQPGTKKFTSFLGYCTTMNHYLHHHHWIEETYWFPFLNEKIGSQSMAHNISDHKDIMSKFSIFEDLVTKLQADPTKFDLTTFRDAIHGFMPELREHLKSEPDTFRPDTLRKHISLEELAEVSEAMDKDIMASISLINDIPLFFVNGDRKNAPWFLPLPALIKFITLYILYYIHSDIWAFGSTYRTMQVKPEFAEYEPEMEPEGLTK